MDKYGTVISPRRWGMGACPGPARLLLAIGLLWACFLSGTAVAGQADKRDTLEVMAKAFIHDVESGRIAVKGLPAEYIVLRTNGMLALQAGKLDEAVRLQKKVITIADRNLPPRLRMSCRVELIRLLFATHREKEAERAFDEALETLHSFEKDSALQAIPALGNIVEERFRGGASDVGEKMANALRPVLEARLAPPAQAAMEKRQLDAAVRAYVREHYASRERINLVEAWLVSRRLDPASKRTGLMAEANLFLAGQYALRGDIPAARKHLDTASGIWREIFDGESQEQLQPFGLMGRLYEQLGQTDSAEKAYRDGVGLGLRFYDPGVEQVAALRNSLAALLVRRRKWDEAGKLLRTTIRDVTNRSGQFRFQVGRAFSLLATIAMTRGNRDQGTAFFRRAFDIMRFTVAADRPELLDVTASMSESLLAAGRYEQAQTFAAQCLERSRSAFGRASPLVARSLFVLGMVQHHLGDDEHARKTMLEAEQTGIAQARKMSEFPSDTARKSFFAASLRNINALFTLFGGREAPGRIGELYDVWLNRKGAFFDSQLRFQQLLFADGSPERRAAFVRLRALRNEIAELVFSQTGPDQAKTKAIRQLQARRDELLEILNKGDDGKGRAGDLATWRDIALPPGGVLIDFACIRGEGGGYRAFVLRPEGAPQLVGLGPTAPIDEAIRALRGEIGKGRRGDVENLQRQSRFLYKTVFAPLENLVRDAKHIVVSPDGLLDLLPLEVLSPRAGAYLVEQHRFSYIASARELLRARPASRSTRDVVVFANPNFDAAVPGMALPIAGQQPLRAVGEKISLALPPLPETETEGRDIAAMAGEDGRLFLRGEASKLVLFSQRRPRILHLASHGFFLADDDPAGGGGRGFLIEEATPVSAEAWIGGDADPLLRSGIVLAGARPAGGGGRLSADGLLTAEDVLGLDLRGTELVTLSACDTGLGVVADADGMYGLRRSFRLAGARNLVLSMWSVPDRETRELMVEMYEGVLEKALTPGTALHTAVLDRLWAAREAGDAGMPMYWAGFIQYGVE